MLARRARPGISAAYPAKELTLAARSLIMRLSPDNLSRQEGDKSFAGSVSASRLAKAEESRRVSKFQARSAASQAKPVGNRPGSTAVTNADRTNKTPRNSTHHYDVILVIVAGGACRSGWSPLVLGGLSLASSGTGSGGAPTRLAA